jgi:hypothetical protein
MEGSKTLFSSSKFPQAWKNFFKIYKQSGQAPSRHFTSPPLDCWTQRYNVLWFCKNIQTTRHMTQHYIPEGVILQQWKMFMNILSSISDGSYCLCLLCPAEADAQRHIKNHTTWQLTNEQSDSSQFTVSLHIEENNWQSLRPFNWTWILLHTHSLTTNTLT